MSSKLPFYESTLKYVETLGYLYPVLFSFCIFLFRLYFLSHYLFARLLSLCLSLSGTLLKEHTVKIKVLTILGMSEAHIILFTALEQQKLRLLLTHSVIIGLPLIMYRHPGIITPLAFFFPSVCLFLSLSLSLLRHILGDPEVTANLYCNFSYWEG